MSEGAAGVDVEAESALKDEGGDLAGVRAALGVDLAAIGLDFEGVTGVRAVAFVGGDLTRSGGDAPDVASAAGISVAGVAASCCSGADATSAAFATGSTGVGSGAGASIGAVSLTSSSTTLFRSGTSSEALDLGGHSLFSLISSFAASPIV